MLEATFPSRSGLPFFKIFLRARRHCCVTLPFSVSVNLIAGLLEKDCFPQRSGIYKAKKVLGVRSLFGINTQH
jgi:hypothetical protein